MAAGTTRPRSRAGARAAPRPDGLPLVPVDFRRCRQESCAVAAGPRLTASNRRTTDFTQLIDRRGPTAPWRSSTGSTDRPSAGEPSAGSASTADVEAAAGTELLESQDPALVPLETLPGHDHYDFPAAEEPPWRWHVEARYPGWSD